MSACKFCGPQFDVTGKFCPNCGKPQEGNFDDQQNLQQFAEIIQDSFFEIDEWQSQDGFLKSTQRVREKLLISHETAVDQFNNLKKYLDEKQPLSEFQLEFNQNVIDAYAGHDTYLQFRFTNKSALGDNYKVYIFWDDRETEDEDDLHIRSNTLIKPNQSIELGGTHIFMRAGPKEISELTITVTNQFKDEAKFKVTPFNFRVKTPTQNVINQITTKNEISIEGRGVVDAANMGNQQPLAAENNEPQWIGLEHFLMPQNFQNDFVSLAPKNLESNENTSQNYDDMDSTDPSSKSLDEVIEAPSSTGDAPKKTKSGNIWSGQFDENGDVHGFGTLQIIKDDNEWNHDDPEFYTGNTIHGEISDLTGTAKITYRSTDYYEGTVFKGLPHGVGTKTFATTEGFAYWGMYAEGNRHGLLEKYHYDEIYDENANPGDIPKFEMGEFISGESWMNDEFVSENYIDDGGWHRIAGSFDHDKSYWIGLMSKENAEGKQNLYAGFTKHENPNVPDPNTMGTWHNLYTGGYQYVDDYIGLIIYGYNNADGSVDGIYHGDIDNKLKNGIGTYITQKNLNNHNEPRKGPSIWEKDIWVEEYKEDDEATEIHPEDNVENDTSTGDQLTSSHEIFDYPVDSASSTIWNKCYFGPIYEVDSHFWDYEWWNFLGHDLNLADEIKSGGNGRKVITDKKRNNVYEVINPHKEEGEFIVLVFDSTLFGSCKDFSLFTNKSFWTKDINMPLVRYNYNFIKKAEPTGKKLNQLKLYLSDNTTYTTSFAAGKVDVVQMHADLLNSLSAL